MHRIEEHAKVVTCDYKVVVSSQLMILNNNNIEFHIEIVNRNHNRILQPLYDGNYSRLFDHSILSIQYIIYGINLMASDYLVTCAKTYFFREKK
jgi:hypothetical protein